MPVNIQGKEYATVNERVAEAHEKWEGNLSIRTRVLESIDGFVRVKATIKHTNDAGTHVFVGHAEEQIGSSFINKTSALENAETSAVGRALAFAGFSTDASIASADEVANAMISQNNTPSTAPSNSTTQAKENLEFDASELDGIDWNVERENEITFGKYKGTAWKDINDGYLSWLAGKKDGKNAHLADLEQTFRIVIEASQESKEKVKEEPKGEVKPISEMTKTFEEELFD
jgi:uncharacterized protein (DUF3820 family)|tara:strand:+ start:532 stop:1224 length:693 start_codon:yes stop_codon:yes gene_type:complete